MKNSLTKLWPMMVLLIVSSCGQPQEDSSSQPTVQATLAPEPLADSSIVKLEQIFGGVSHDGAGSSVYRITKEDAAIIDTVAWQHFKEYLGPKYTDASAAQWKKGWEKVYVREVHPDSSSNINTELNRHKDPRVKSSVPLLLEFVQPVVKARQALAGAYNRKDIKELAIFVIGDGEAYSGLLIAGRYEDGSGCTLIAMAD